MEAVIHDTLDDPVYLDRLRHDLLRFARLQLRDPDAAEDAVQESLASAWTHADQFDGQSSHKTWVFGILRHKLIDSLRARRRTVNASALESDRDDESIFDRELFDERGHWTDHTRPRPWPKPDTLLQQQQFWMLFEACLHRLPEHLGRVFMMREFLDVELAAICDELDLTANHCSVLLYRARSRLRVCLTEHGLGADDAAGNV
ncbi:MULTISPECIES: RNA polymerase factor sigma-70 [Burkholderia cepacia complex]|uniref:RNA polymerase factor sigma-70 n=1 Tax=Burkholderia cepacia complex TaxID=87882 RepID=UPI001F4AEDB6|nr:RNA polymerase factor sigma-70 [Burkholderia cenocepacia]